MQNKKHTRDCFKYKITPPVSIVQDRLILKACDLWFVFLHQKCGNPGRNGGIMREVTKEWGEGGCAGKS